MLKIVCDHGSVMEARPKILLVDDEVSITSTLTVFLNLSGFEVQVAHDGEEALHRVENEVFDLIILDILMPQLDGRETLRRMRRDNNWTPVILLTQIDGTPERIMALEEGADDYLNKPFEPQELVVRIRVILRRTRQGSRSTQMVRRLASESLVLDRLSRRVWFQDREVTLTPKAVSILEYLMLHPDELITRDDLLNAIWGWEKAVGTRVIDTRIAELRKVIREDPAQPRFIETVPGQGYRFVGDVIELG
jgi:DNA-binding response OmpR family regulator